VAYGYLVATYILLVLRLFYSFKGTPVDVKTFYKAIEKPLIGSIAMMVVLVVFNKLIVINNSLLLLSISLPVAVVTYLIAWMLMPGGRDDLREIIYDFITPLHLGKYGVLMNFFGKKIGAR
jgi:hypothetical protein